MAKSRLIAFYLPQFHEIPENDKWWGRGFTEWVNVKRARKLFPGHYQPKIPADLGYYDLLSPIVQNAQAQLAREAGIDGFCYWHYWFNGKRLLEKPIQEIMASGKPDFPFCFCWANHSWEKKTWVKGSGNTLLIEQTYPGDEDYIAHFNAILPAFRDDRYIKIDGKPFFGIFSPRTIPDAKHFTTLWNELARRNGFEGMHFSGICFKKEQCDELMPMGFNSAIYDAMFKKDSMVRFIAQVLHKLLPIPSLIDYNDYSKTVLNATPVDSHILPCVIPNFDHTPRSGIRGALFYNSSPKKWKTLLEGLLQSLSVKQGASNIVIVKSWNEWGEGNYLEPDSRYGKGYILATREAVDSVS